MKARRTKALASAGAFYCFEKKEKKEELVLPSCSLPY
jgi:hypothetical protein